MKHTPGPWKLETVKTQIGHCHKIGPFPGSCGKDPGCACVYVDGQQAPKAQTGKEEELLANAVLMTASPDLLAACELVEQALRSRDTDAWFPIHTRLAVQDAIKKATGPAERTPIDKLVQASKELLDAVATL